MCGIIGIHAKDKNVAPELFDSLVHSLLPAFSGLTDRKVHEAMPDSGAKETGCTTHLVDEIKDAGEILVQKKCEVKNGDTVDSLKERVQLLEGEALLEAIQKQYVALRQGNSQ